MPSQQKNSDMFCFRRAAFYQSLRCKVGLAAAKAAALRINFNNEGCGHSRTPSPPNARSLSHSPSSPPPSFTQSLSPPRSLVRGGQTSLHRPRLVVSHRTCPPLSPSPHANSFVLGTAVINTNMNRDTSIMMSRPLHNGRSRARPRTDSASPHHGLPDRVTAYMAVRRQYCRLSPDSDERHAGWYR
jgi:hypothetical protein